MGQNRNVRKRLLILACSSRKTHLREMVAAIDRYDGVAYRVIKRLQRLGEFPENVDIVILSGKYGLITSSQRIHDYDLPMTAALIKKHASQTRSLLRQLTGTGRYGEVFVSAGRNYVAALHPFDAWLRQTPVIVNSGRIGTQLRALREWLLT